MVFYRNGFSEIDHFHNLVNCNVGINMKRVQNLRAGLKVQLYYKQTLDLFAKKVLR